ncbi:RidA family protein [Vacuolonema iberomarrocanum]|uniref:RidA family protein n=1 Tax=Vacuolonema iberomarrocanum TaxID=3454632 RepID=UPI0019F513A4|nr:RidA family protein [filamentous cyanobacterium LEGE 07170]
MSIEHLNPAGLHKNPVFSQVVVTRGDIRTIYIGGQNAITPSGESVGKDDIGRQAEQIFANLEIALASAGAQLEHVIKWTVYVLQGQPPQPAFEVFQRIWGKRPNPPLITLLFVAGLAHPDFLMEIEAIAVLPDADG